MKDSTTVQLDKEYYIAVVNKASDEVAKSLGCSLTAPQIAFLKTVVRPLATFYHSLPPAYAHALMRRFSGCQKLPCRCLMRFC